MVNILILIYCPSSLDECILIVNIDKIMNIRLFSNTGVLQECKLILFPLLLWWYVISCVLNCEVLHAQFSTRRH